MNTTQQPHQMSRRARFAASIKLARTTAGEWCREQGFTPSHLYQVMRGDRTSPETLSRVDAFIAKQLGEAIPTSTTAV